MATEIAALIASRICHDLISPIGAIGNGMELMALSSGQEQSSPELDLISQSVVMQTHEFVSFGSPTDRLRAPIWWVGKRSCRY